MAKCKQCGKWKLFGNWPNELCPDCETATKEQAEKSTESAQPPVVQTNTDDNVKEPTAPETVAAAPKKVAAKKSGPKVYRVTGMSYHMDNLMRLALEDDNFSMTKKEMIDYGLVGERVYKYFFDVDKVDLIPEPENPHDPNAIKVIVDKEHVGYIKAGSCAHLLKVINGNRIKKISCEISGGPYKYIEEDFDYDKEKEVYTLERGESPYSVVLSIDEQ